MRITKLIYLFISVLLLTACSPQQNTLHDIYGKAIHLKSLQGKWVVINYWAKWCKPCLEEIPQLNALYRAHKAKVIVLGINYDQLPDPQQQQLARELAINYPLLSRNPAEQFGIESTQVVPATYIINPQGKLQDSLLGPQSRDKLEKLMNLR